MCEKDIDGVENLDPGIKTTDDRRGHSKDASRSDRKAPDAEVIASKGKRAPSRRIVVPDHTR